MQPSRPLPRKLAAFEIEAQLGAGGMAEVFLAKKRGAEGTYKRLVVKRILESNLGSQRFRAMFAEEAQLATRLNHPNIVQVYDFQDYGPDGQLLSMEYVEGPDLRKLSRCARAKGTRIDPFVAAYVIGEAAKGLHYAHDRKDEGGNPLEIVHRDVSPQNILLSFDGAVKIADFGIATANLFRQEPGVLKGKTGYMSPEQARLEKVDRRSDIYSLGVVFHELLTGQPIHGVLEGKELLEAVRCGAVEPPSLFARGVPPELEAIVMRALALEPDARYASARELSAAINQALFESHHLIDSHALEAAIAELMDRNVVKQVEPRAMTDAPAAFETSTSNAPSTGSDSSVQVGRQRTDREVRHVSIVHLNINGRPEVEQLLGKARTARLADQLRSTLDEIAFKQRTRWTWDDDESHDGQTAVALGGARAIVGLTDNPSRATIDAARLAVFVHDAIAGACDGLSKGFQASVSIVRGVAEGRRDSSGHLSQFSIHAPAEALASFLCDRTPPGHTWVAGAVFRLLRRDFVWQDAPSVELEAVPGGKLQGNMRVYGLERPLTRSEQREVLALAPRDLIGRDAELAELHAAYHQCVTGTVGTTGQLVARAIVGELGIGKTALASTFLSELPPTARELRVECSPYGSDTPFGNAAIWLRELAGVHADDTTEQARSAIVDALGNLPAELPAAQVVDLLLDLATGHLIEASDESDAALHRRLLSTGLRYILARAARQSPLVFMVDGLQWIDLPSLDFLASLIRRGDRIPILLLLVSRVENRVLSLLDGIVRLELYGLTPDNLQQLVEAHVQTSHGVREACADLIPRAAGNPFFLLEMVDSLLERNNLRLQSSDTAGQFTLVRAANGAGQETLPSTLEQLLADRLNELAGAERSIVDWLAVGSCPLLRSDLALLLGIEAGLLDAAIQHLRDRGICEAVGDTLDVRHPMTRDVAYKALPPSERADMHRQLGELLSQRPSARGLGAALVAKHFALGKVPLRAADFYLEAAAVARLSFQIPLAARYYQQALDALPKLDARRLEPYAVLEEVCRTQGRWRERRQYLSALRETARQLGDLGWVASALLRHAQYEFDIGHFERSIKLSELAGSAAIKAQSPALGLQAQSLMAEALRDHGETQRALVTSGKAVEATTHGDVQPRFRGEVLRAHATLLARVGRIDEAVAMHAEAIAIFRQASARRLEARAKSSLSYAVYVLGRYEDAIALALEALRIDLSIGGRFQIAKTLSNIAQAYGALGEQERARTYFRRALEAHERYEDQDCRNDTWLCNVDLLVRWGRLEDAQRMLNELDVHALPPASYDSVHAAILRARLAQLAGDHPAAVFYASQARSTAEAQNYASFHCLAMALEGLGCVESGELEAGVAVARAALDKLRVTQGCEFDLEVQQLCVQALERGGASRAADARRDAEEFIARRLATIRDPALRAAFEANPVVADFLQAPQGERGPAARAQGSLNHDD